MAEPRAKDRLEPDPAARRELRSTLLFLLVPGVVFGAAMMGVLSLPSWLLYAVAGILGLVVFVRSLTRPEWLLAVTILYLPLCKLVVVPLAPLVNGVNIVIAMLLVSWYSTASRAGRPLFLRLPNTGIALAWAAVSCFSVVTAAVTLGTSFVADEILNFKAYADQFIIFFAFVNLIRDGKMAKRLVVYMIIGFLIVTLLGVDEMREKAGMSSIEKSRLLGPQLQPNDFGAFLVYAVSPLLAYFFHHIYQLRAWPLAPVFVVTVRLLLTTFSRGAYIGLGIAGVVAAYVRGKLFLITGVLLAVLVVVSFPDIVPDSLRDRMSQTKSEDSEQLDRSAETRVILWRAGVKMTLDYPVLGVGFKGFTVLKDQYTEVQVPERDNHNMFLYISTQMGIPALLVFLALLYKMYATGAKLYRQSSDRTTRIVGLGGAVMVAGVFGVNMFGSRMTGIEVNGYFWVYLAVLAHLLAEHQSQAVKDEPAPAPRPRPWTAPPR